MMAIRLLIITSKLVIKILSVIREDENEKKLK
jgi:hypothetical protein